MKLLGMGIPEFLIIVAIIVVLFFVFGPKNLPKIGAAFGKSVKNFKESAGVGKKSGKKSGSSANAAAGGSPNGTSNDMAIEGEVITDEPEESTFEKIGKKAGSAAVSAKEIGSQFAAGATAAAAEIKAGADSVKNEDAAQKKDAQSVGSDGDETAASSDSEDSRDSQDSQESTPNKRVVKRVVKKPAE